MADDVFITADWDTTERPGGLEPTIHRESIKKWPGYFAGSDGVIYSIKSGDFTPVATWLGGRKRCQYKKVTLRRSAGRGRAGKGRPGTKRNFYVHDLVAVAFCGPRRRKTWQARHKDGDRFNNASDNLTWGTKRQNERDKIAAGTAPRGERNGGSKLTEVDAAEILASEETTREIAERKKISVRRVQAIRAGSAWAHLPAPLSPGP
jgi:hypothetical protein